MSKPKLIVCFSDIHCGSTVGLLKPGFVTHEGIELGLNDVQKWLWSSWLDCWKWAKEVIGKDEWIAVANGDLTESVHHGTKQVVSPDDGDHMMIAVDILGDVLKGCSEAYLVEGTEAHVKNMEHAIGKKLKSEGIPVKSPKGLGAWPSLKMRVNDTLCSFEHHVTTSIRSYLESSAYAISMGDMRNRLSRADQEVPKCFVRSHRHQYGSYDDGYSSMTILPPWQAATRFVHKVVPGAVPQCGLVVLDFRHVEPNAPPVVFKRLHTIKQA